MLMREAGEDDGEQSWNSETAQRRRKFIEERTPWYPSTTDDKNEITPREPRTTTAPLFHVSARSPAKVKTPVKEAPP